MPYRRCRRYAAYVSTAKRKGTWAETVTVTYLNQAGFPYAERRTLSGALDRGDVSLCPGVIAEVKNHRTPHLGPWMAETERERVNAGAELAALIVKPPGLGATRVGQWWAGMPYGAYANLRGGDMSRLVELGALRVATLSRALARGDDVLVTPRGVVERERFHVFSTVDRLVRFLRESGFGDPYQ